MSPLFEDSENDLPLPGRRVATDPDTRRAREVDTAHQPEREVTLNTGIVLALFFALALLCAVFFGFGYSMGRKSVPPPTIAETDNTSTLAETDTGNAGPKPSPGSPASVPVPSYAGPTSATTDAKPKPASTAGDATPVITQSLPRTAPASGTSAAIEAGAPIVRVAPASTPAAASTSTQPASSGSIFVQVSAVSHQEDADVLLSALRRRGYTVFTRSDPNDHLIHVQLGPYSTRKDADAMRTRLSGDGYNAILK